jgi:hypothetical protein
MYHYKKEVLQLRGTYFFDDQSLAVPAGSQALVIPPQYLYHRHPLVRIHTVTTSVGLSVGVVLRPVIYRRYVFVRCGIDISRWCWVNRFLHGTPPPSPSLHVLLQCGEIACGETCRWKFSTNQQKASGATRRCKSCVDSAEAERRHRVAPCPQLSLLHPCGLNSRSLSLEPPINGTTLTLSPLSPPAHLSLLEPRINWTSISLSLSLPLSLPRAASFVDHDLSLTFALSLSLTLLSLPFSTPQVPT